MNMKPQKISENVTLFSADPIVYVVSDFLSDAECNAFIESKVSIFQSVDLNRKSFA